MSFVNQNDFADVITTPPRLNPTDPLNPDANAGSGTADPLNPNADAKELNKKQENARRNREDCCDCLVDCCTDCDCDTSDGDCFLTLCCQDFWSCCGNFLSKCCFCCSDDGCCADTACCDGSGEASADFCADCDCNCDCSD